jgi:Bacterial Ig domain
MHHPPLGPLVVSLLLVLGSSCTSDKPSVPPVQKTAASGSASVPVPAGSAVSGSFSLAISPLEPNRQTTLGVKAVGFDISSAHVQWLLNDNPVWTEVPAQFNCSDAAKGSTVQARATVLGKDVRSNIVEIRNSPPELTKVRLLPETFKPGDTLMIEAEAMDIDGDPVTILYAWSRNGAPAGNAAKINAQVKRGDTVTVSLTPYDGQSYGTAVVLDREISNIPPYFIAHKNFSYIGSRYSYQAQTVDPDGDAVTYSLVDPAEGMTIDRSTGELVWNVPPDFKGEQSVTIMADDGHGGTAHYTIFISISQ